MRTRALTGACLLALSLAACAGRPSKVLAEADGALADAKLAEKCAPEEYAAAKRMVERANQLADEGKNAEAEKAARAAKKLAQQARNKAMLRREECEKPAQPTAGGIDPDDFIDRDATQAPVDVAIEGMRTIYFDYDAFDLTPETREALARNAQWLKANPDARVVIAGHCDKRGSTEYNLALGERRAQVVRRYLESLGVDAQRMSIISYGEEQPADWGDSDESHRLNRRAEFKASR